MKKAIGSNQYASLLKWLKSAREGQGLSMRDMEALIHKPHSWIGKVESGERRLDVYEYVQYGQVLGIDPNDGIKLLK